MEVNYSFKFKVRQIIDKEQEELFEKFKEENKDWLKIVRQNALESIQGEVNGEIYGFEVDLTEGSN